MYEYLLHLFSMGSLVAHVYRHDMRVAALRRTQALCEWTLMESEQFLHNHARTTTASQESNTKEGQSDKGEKRRCIHGESSGHRYKVKH